MIGEDTIKSWKLLAENGKEIFHKDVVLALIEYIEHQDLVIDEYIHLIETMDLE